MKLEVVIKFVALLILTFCANHLYSQCTNNVTYNGSDQGSIPDLTQAAIYVNAEDVTIAPNENIAFESGRYSILKPGFNAEYESVFSSKIVPCSPITCSINNGTQIGSIDRGPFLQKSITDPITDKAEVIIKWRDILNVTYTVDVISASGTTVSFSENDVELANDGPYRILSLIGLNPNAMYQYNINYTGSNEEPIIGFFRTAPIVGSDIPDYDPVSFWVMGDAGSTYQTNIEEMRNSYFNYTGDEFANSDLLKDCNSHFSNTDFIINLGDNAYQKGTEEELQKAVFEPYQKILKYLPLWAAGGNHESDYPFIVGNDTINGDDIHKNVFELPKVDTLDGDNIDVNEQYYSFDYANIHFVCLYSQFQTSRDSLYTAEDGESKPTGNRYDDYRKMYEDMFEWLETDLTQAQDHSKWTVLFFHKPVLTAGGRSKRSTMVKIERDSEEMRNGIDSITNKYDIDLVLYGHSHHYERSYLVRCGNGDWEWDGTVTEASDNLGPVKLNDHYGDFEILDYGCVDDNDCDQANSIYDDVFEKQAGVDNGTVFVLCGASSKTDKYLCADGIRHKTYQDFLNHPAMRIFHSQDTRENCEVNTSTTFGGRGKYEIGSLNFEVKNNELKGTYISKDNSVVLDQFTIVKNFSNYKQKQAEKIVDIKPSLSVVPNPFGSSFTINYDVSKEEIVNIDLFSIDGKQIKSILKGVKHTAGQHTKTIDTNELQPGIYLIRVISPSNQLTKKVMKVVPYK